MNIANITSFSNDNLECGFDQAKVRAAELESPIDRIPTAQKLPLQRDTCRPKPFPFDALGPILGPAAKRLNEVVRAPDAICGQSVLATAALVTQAHADIHIDGRVHPVSLFLLSIAESGDRKSAIDSIVLAPVREYEKQLHSSYKEAKTKFKNRLDIWKKKREEILSKTDPLFIETELTKLDPEPEPPLQPFLLLEEPTYEGLVKLFCVGQPTLGLFSDEGGRLFGGHAMGKEQQIKTACGLSSIWDGKPVTRIRGSDENLLLHGRRLSCHLMIQETVFAPVLKNNELIGQGWLARFLIVCPESTAGDRPYNQVNISTDPSILDFRNRLNEILDTPYPVTRSEENTLLPRALELNEIAMKRWIDFHDEIDRSLKVDGIYYSIRRTANKAAEQVLRIAGVLALFENLNVSYIDSDNLDRAIVLMQFYLDESLRIMNTVSVDPDLDLARRLLEWMSKKQREVGSGKEFDLIEIYQKGGPREIRNKATALKILRILEEHGHIQSLKEKSTWVLTA